MTDQLIPKHKKYQVKQLYAILELFEQPHPIYENIVASGLTTRAFIDMCRSFIKDGLLKVEGFIKSPIGRDIPLYRRNLDPAVKPDPYRPNPPKPLDEKETSVRLRMTYDALKKLLPMQAVEIAQRLGVNTVMMGRWISHLIMEDEIYKIVDNERRVYYCVRVPSLSQVVEPLTPISEDDAKAIALLAKDVPRTTADEWVNPDLKPNGTGVMTRWLHTSS